MDIELKINLKDYIKVRDCLKWVFESEAFSGNALTEVKEAFEIIDNLVSNDKAPLHILPAGITI